MKRLAITLGDPAGIGPEIVLKAIRDAQLGDYGLALFGDAALTRITAADLSLPFEIRVISSLVANDSEPLLFVDAAAPGASAAALRYGTIDARYGAIALRSIGLAVDAIEAGFCDALVTAPVHKEAIAAAGARFPGHTELLAERAGLTEYGRDFAMYFDSDDLRVALLSVHVPLRRAIALISAAKIAELAALLDRELTRLHGQRPRLGVAGLNPHAGEGGLFGDEEKVIAEGIERAAAEGICISGPHAADTIFHNALRGKFDAILALYHDQGLIAVKSVAFERSVNVTLGLPYLRASVDHGTAFDIAGKGVADYAPMRFAIEWCVRHAGRMKR